MTTIAVDASAATRPPRRATAPVVAAAATALLGVLWLTLLVRHHGDITGFIEFGRYFAAAIHPPAHAAVPPGFGYDGQYFWRMAVSPLLADHAVVNALSAHQQYRAQRMMYPTLAWLLAGGQRALVPYTLQLVGFASVIALVALLASTARRRALSAWWGFAGLMPGMYLGMARDLADPLSVTLAVATFVALDRRRLSLAAVAAAAAVLSRETMLFIPLALTAALVLGRIGVPDPLKPRPLPAGTWMVAATSFGAYIAWQAYATVRLGAVPAFATPSGQFGAPLATFPHQIAQTALDAGGGGQHLLLALANPLYLAGIVAASALAVWALIRRGDAIAICATLFALVAVSQTYGDHWSYTRATAPLFALVALIAIERRHRRTLAFVAAGVGLLPLYPL
jgi:hypothetical protein